ATRPTLTATSLRPVPCCPARTPPSPARHSKSGSTPCLDQPRWVACSEPEGEPMTLARLARWCYRRRRLVVLLWVIGFVVLNAVGAAIGNDYSDNFSGGHSDSVSAFNLLKTRFPARAGDTTDIVFTFPRGVNDPAVRARMESLFAQVGPGRVPHVVALDSPYQAPGRVSRDGSIAYATVTFDKQAGDL